MKILTTGGTGFIGSPFLNNLVKNFNEVEILNLTRSNQISNSKNVENFRCDLSNPRTYQTKVETFEPEVVIHLAWEGIPDFSLEICIKNIFSSISLIEIVTKIDSCKKIIVTGSCFEYSNKLGKCNENDLFSAKDYFTFAKNTVLSFLEFECNKKNIVYGWARLFYVYGPNQRSGSLVPTLISALRSNVVPNLRTPKNANDFIFVEDVANALVKMTSNDFQSGIYNIGSGKSIPIIEVLKIVELALFKNVVMTSELAERTKNTQKDVDFFADISKAFVQFNWEPKIGILEGIKSIIEE
jgi:nucleoside-diphosphate-sugar epimerase